MMSTHEPVSETRGRGAIDEPCPSQLPRTENTTMSHFPSDRPGEPTLEPETYQHFTLPQLLPAGHTLALNLDLGTLSLLLPGPDGPRLVAEQQFTDSELCVLQPLLEAYPHFCPYEVLLASFTNARVTDEEVARSRERLQGAQAGQAWDDAIRPVRNVLSRTRLKLHAFHVDVRSILETGYVLMPARNQGGQGGT